MSLIECLSHPPSTIVGWTNTAVKAWGLYAIYDVIRFKDQDSAWYLWFIGLFLGGSSILRAAILIYTLAPVMQNSEGMEPINDLIWMTLTVVLITAGVQCLCGAAFWLPSVKNYLASHQPEHLEDDGFDLEPDQYGISLGPAITMSGPEFMEWLKENEGEHPPEGIGLYIKIPESLSPAQRHDKYANPIGDFLEAGDFGYVDGGGTMISKEQMEIEYVGIDAVVFQREPGVAAVIQILQELNAPQGTEIHLSDEEIVNVW